MKMGRLITGGILTGIGVTLFLLSFIHSFSLIIYSVPIFLLGLSILLNSSEDRIEGRKDLNKRFTHHNYERNYRYNFI
jgi:sulfite exporter TauE/SafE